jgi:hypothetical protein
LYGDKVNALLTNLELRCIKYCEMEEVGGAAGGQLDLMKDLNQLSQRVANKIIDWKWFLRSGALAERAASHARYKTLP